MTHTQKEGEKRERLSELEHEQWIAWSKNIAETETITPARLERWKELWKPYDALTEAQKDQDREWADKVLAIISPTTPDRPTDWDTRGDICEMTSKMLDTSNEYGIYPTGKFYDRMEAYINMRVTSAEKVGEERGKHSLLNPSDLEPLHVKARGMSPSEFKAIVDSGRQAALKEVREKVEDCIDKNDDGLWVGKETADYILSLLTTLSEQETKEI